MASQLDTILTASLVAFFAAVVYWTLSQRTARRLVTSLLLIAVAIWVVAALTPDASSSRSGISETASIVLCYLSMLLGMMAEYGYVQAERGNKKFQFELMSFLMPIFASPIVFIPLLTLTSDVATGGPFSRAKLMVYLVAFQNGFFWKSFFEERRTRVQAMARGEAAVV